MSRQLILLPHEVLRLTHSSACYHVGLQRAVQGQELPDPLPASAGIQATCDPSSTPYLLMAFSQGVWHKD